MDTTLKSCRLDCYPVTGIWWYKHECRPPRLSSEPAAGIPLFGATKLLDESFNIKSFNPASDRGCRQLRAGLAVDYGQPPRPFGRGSPQ
jgi:hypothetical protein